MDTRRVVLYAALALIIYTLWTNWQMDYPAPQPVSAANTSTSSGNKLLPNIPGTESNTSGSAIKEQGVSSANEKTGQVIHVKTDVFNMMIDTRQGDVVRANLLNYPVSVSEQDKPITILNEQPDQQYVANSSLFIHDGKQIDTLDLNYTTASNNYQMEPGQNSLVVTLEGETTNGLKVKKTFTFTRGSYLINVAYVISNQGNEPWKGYMNTQLLRSTPEEDKSSMFHVGSYTGASYSIPGQSKYKKVSFKDMDKNNLNAQADGGWIAMQQHYFLSSWIPAKEAKNTIYTRASAGDYTIGSVSPAIQVNPGESEKIAAGLYVGPENTEVLQGIAPGLELTVDYGWLWFLSSILFSIMKAIHSVLGNWGWSIVLVTVLIKLAFYRLSASSYKSMAGMRKLQPKLQALRERYGDDKAKLSQATMELYRGEQVNPLGGCLPILVQIPVFIALYWVLLESVELRQAPFMFWIKDLSAADPYHVLPIIMGATMLIQQRLNPAPPDPTQAKVMMFLPVLFTALFWSFPAGLVLYWIVNNTLSILQQWYITRKYSDDKPVNKKMVTVK